MKYLIYNLYFLQDLTFSFLINNYKLLYFNYYFNFLNFLFFIFCVATTIHCRAKPTYGANFQTHSPGCAPTGQGPGLIKGAWTGPQAGPTPLAPLIHTRQLKHIQAISANTYKEIVVAVCKHFNSYSSARSQKHHSMLQLSPTSSYI